MPLLQYAGAVAASRVVGSGGAFGTVIVANTDSNVVTTELAVRDSSAFVLFLRPQMRGPGRNGVIVIEEGPTADGWRETVFIELHSVLLCCNYNTPQCIVISFLYYFAVTN
jgi:hypothetical protein